MKVGRSSRALLLVGLAAFACGMSALVSPPRAAAAPPAGDARTPTLVFRVLSDTHVTKTNTADFANALRDFNSLGGAAALFIDGDAVDTAAPANYAALRATIAANTKTPTYLAIGNHEFHGRYKSSTDLWMFLAAAGRPTVYAEQTLKGYPFLILGGEKDLNGWTASVGTAQLNWLDRRLAALATRTRPTFVLLHQPPQDTDQATALNRILAAHPGVVVFWGHYHMDLVRNTPGVFNNAAGYYMVHCASTHYLGGDYTRAEGVQVEVYPDHVLVRGRDFIAHAWIPTFQKTIPSQATP